MLRIAIQSSGRTHDESLRLLDEVGVRLSFSEAEPFIVRSVNLPIEVLFVQKERVPSFVADGAADIGICSEFLAHESDSLDVRVLKHLGFGKATLSLAVPQSVKYRGIDWFRDRTIATPYPDVLARFFKEKSIRTNIKYLSERVYIAPQIGLADAICDRVYSGTTLMSHNLKEVETIMQSESVLISSRKLHPSKQILLDALLLRIDSAQNARNRKILRMLVPKKSIDEIISIITLTNKTEVWTTVGESMAKLEAVVDEKWLWDVIEHFKELGAGEISIIQIENFIN